jgi:flagellar basal body-associated protein FliL
MEEKENNNQCCGTNNDSPSCCCSASQNDSKKTDGRKILKILICIIVLMVVAGIVAYRIISTNSKSKTVSNVVTGFDFGQSSPNSAFSHDYIIQAENNLGDYLKSFEELNIVANSNDAVFVYIPDMGNVMVDGKTKSTISDVQRYLARSSIKIGLYTLWHDSPDYSTISMQCNTPAIVIALKGASAVAIPASNIDEYTLLKAFQTCCDTSIGCCQ